MAHEAPDDQLRAPDIGDVAAPISSGDVLSRASFDRHDVAGAPVLAASGEIDLACESEFDIALTRTVLDAAQQGRTVAVVDLERVDFISSRGAAVLLHAHGAARPRGVELRVVASAYPHVGRALDLLRLGAHLAVYADRDQALSPPPGRPPARGEGS